VRHLLQVRCVPFLKLKIGQPETRRPSVPGLDQVLSNIDPQHVGTEFRRGHSCGAVAAAEIQHLKSLRDSEFLHDRLSAFAHRVGNAREIAFFPQCFVWISRSIHTLRVYRVLSRQCQRYFIIPSFPIYFILFASYFPGLSHFFLPDSALSIHVRSTSSLSLFPSNFPVLLASNFVGGLCCTAAARSGVGHRKNRPGRDEDPAPPRGYRQA